MYFDIFTILVIVTYQCSILCPFTIGALEHVTSEPTPIPGAALRDDPELWKDSVEYEESEESEEILKNYTSKRGPMDCYLHVSRRKYKLPIPYSLSFRPSILIPDIQGYIYIKHKTSFKVTCTATSRFKNPIFNGEDELFLTCAGKRSLEYNGNTYLYEDFECEDVPKAKLILSNFKCQSNRYNMAAIGFQAKNKFLILYNVCFDTLHKITLYTWYRINSPYRNVRQIFPERPEFIRSRQLYGLTDVNTIYKTQKMTLKKLLKSRDQVDKFINDTAAEELFLSRGHLTARTEFYYAFEQHATFFYENTAPQWQVFNKVTWRQVEKYFRSKLAEERTGRHLIVTGTYGLCTLPDINNVSRPLYLDQPKGIPVPKLIWKLDYNIDTEFGVVFIGLNDPYQKHDRSVYICRTIRCPFKFREEYIENDGLVYCCTINSFLQKYGKLDALVFLRNLL